ncbi:trans-aconitate 2-methyltransferase [Microbacterium sp. MPKO10]|uniref:class I SAM-dependent methyltransferase n=1 Tax=Microbacterium sp. MPKO10 TaxID=2989818 RepID=UPI0022367D69|nr:class I SAM-dependent methyltransferase [Microbacterium sp. MPKO10]MCW4456818.1 class I SAM-dependent methyltransferase [Microbacterium sp. MPKO10]
MARQYGALWNHNIHFHRVVLEAIPDAAISALDVGTGNGLLARDLRERLPDVTAVDVDATTLAAAQEAHSGIDWVVADAMTYDFGRTFDVVASVATMHHFDDLERALGRLKELTAPGGILVVVGLARATTPADYAWGLLGAVQHQRYSRTRNFWQHTAPTKWPPPHSYTEVRECAARVLPGARWQRFALWRYCLTWRQPPLTLGE